jgi:hypothetical protein
MWGGPYGHGPNKNDFLLKRAQWFSDFTRLTNVVENYTFGSSFSYCVLHLKGEEVFGFAKQFIDCPLGAKNDYHCPNDANFSHPWIHVGQPNVVGM